MRPTKSIDHSRTEQVHFLRYEDINGEGRLFGGKLLSWIDEVGGITARRHTGMKVTTAAIDHLQFKSPAFLNQLVVVTGHVTHVGNSSLEVQVDTWLEELDGRRHLMNRAYVTMVALDDHDQPTPIPCDIAIESESARGEWESAIKRVELRKRRRQEGF
ncbi:MAG: acyl-CoA thioesterase [Lachnospiraceae bacterium]|jgi:acyl-CoA hydrolase|nr:acyl-CoA thioesterase [Lachnospiraceae bacterium]